MMIWRHGLKLSALGATVGLLVTGCGVFVADKDGPPSAQKAVESAIGRVKASPSMKASYKMWVDCGSYAQAKLTGEAEMVAGSRLHASYEQTVKPIGQADLVDRGELTVIDGVLYQKWPGYKLPKGKTWVRFTRIPTLAIDKPVLIGWYSLGGLPALDPLLTLGEGTLNPAFISSSPATVDGKPGQDLKVQRNADADPGPRFAAWARAGGINGANLTLTVDGTGRPSRLKIDTYGMCFITADISYRDADGTPTITPPPAAQVR